MSFKNLLPGLALMAITTLPSLSSAQTRTPDLAGIGTGRGWTVVNRSAELMEKDGRTVVTFNAQPGDGAAWLDGVDFENGTIEVLIRGKNVPQRSFVGIAFRGMDDQTYDAVYFRPFNFLAESPLSRSHHVQYVSHPENTWSKLREEHTGVYENEILDPPDPDGFFKARIEIMKPEIRVFINDRTEPCLVVNELTDRTGGRVGLWMGNNSDGSFAQLVLTPAGRP